MVERRLPVDKFELFDVFTRVLVLLMLVLVFPLDVLEAVLRLDLVETLGERERLALLPNDERLRMLLLLVRIEVRDLLLLVLLLLLLTLLMLLLPGLREAKVLRLLLIFKSRICRRMDLTCSFRRLTSALALLAYFMAFCFVRL